MMGAMVVMTGRHSSRCQCLDARSDGHPILVTIDLNARLDGRPY